MHGVCGHAMQQAFLQTTKLKLFTHWMTSSGVMDALSLNSENHCAGPLPTLTSTMDRNRLAKESKCIAAAADASCIDSCKGDAAATAADSRGLSTTTAGMKWVDAKRAKEPLSQTYMLHQQKSYQTYLPSDDGSNDEDFDEIDE